MKIKSCIPYLNISHTLASKYFDYQFLATSYERGQRIPSGGDKRGGKRIADETRIITLLKGDSSVLRRPNTKILKLEFE